MRQLTPEAFYRFDQEETMKELNRRYGVIESVDELKGWHLVSADLQKPGAYRISMSRTWGAGSEMRHGFVSQEILTTARELGYVTQNGFTMP